MNAKTTKLIHKESYERQSTNGSAQLPYMRYDFGDSTPGDWPRSYVAAEEYDEPSRRIYTMERGREALSHEGLGSVH